MHVTINTLRKETFQVEVKSTDTIQKVKQKIEKQKGVTYYPVALQKLIYSGQVLEDDKTLSHYNVEESKCIIVMVSKHSNSESTKANAQKNFLVNQQQQIIKSEENPSSDVPRANPDSISESLRCGTSNNLPPQPSTNEAISSTTLNSINIAEMELMADNIVTMGFDRESVVNALTVSLNDPDLALEYLMSEQSPLIDSNEMQTESSENSELVEYIRTHPELQTMTNLMRENPRMLSTFLQQMAQENPELLQYVNEHQGEFMQLLASTSGESIESSNPSITTNFDSRLNPQEMADIEQLSSLGFTEAECVQAYLACEKNVQLAADLLLSDGNV